MRDHRHAAIRVANRNRARRPRHCEGHRAIGHQRKAAEHHFERGATARIADTGVREPQRGAVDRTARGDTLVSLSGPPEVLIQHRAIRTRHQNAGARNLAHRRRRRPPRYRNGRTFARIAETNPIAGCKQSRTRTRRVPHGHLRRAEKLPSSGAIRRIDPAECPRDRDRARRDAHARRLASGNVESPIVGGHIREPRCKSGKRDRVDRIQMSLDELGHGPSQQFGNLAQILSVVGNRDIEHAPAALPANGHVQLPEPLDQRRAIDDSRVEANQHGARARNDFVDAVHFAREQPVEKRQRRFETLELDQHAGRAGRKDAHLLRHGSLPCTPRQMAEARRRARRVAFAASEQLQRPTGCLRGCRSTVRRS